MSKPSADSLRDAAQSVAHAFDLVIEEIEVRGRGGATVIDVVVDLPEDRIGSADIDTIADFSRALSDLLDTDPELTADGEMLLEVSTPGAERALTRPRHFRRARTRLLDLLLADGSHHRARLLDVSDDEVLSLRPEPGKDDRGRPVRLPKGTPTQLDIPIGDVASARVEIEFSPPADAVPPSGPAAPTDDSER